MRREGKVSGECGGTARPCFAPGQICVVASSDAADQTLRCGSPHGVHHDGAAASFEPFGHDGADAARSLVTIAVCLLGLSRDEFLQPRRV
jgi:hypothetical protein